MRTRTKVSPGYPRENLPKRTVNTNGVESFTTVETPAEPYRYTGIITDISQDDKDSSGNLFFEVRHDALRFRVEGFIPDYRPNFSQPYQGWYTDASQTGNPGLAAYLIEAPTMTLLGNVLQLFPELGLPIQGKHTLDSVLHWTDWAKEEWKGPKVTLSSDFSLINFLLEWRESLALTASWLSKRALIDRWHALMGRNQRLPFRLKAAANERLAHVYGTRLFISDAKQLFRILTSWKERADRYLAQSGMIQRKYKTPLYRAFDAPLIERVVPIFQANHSVFTLKSSWVVEAHAVLAYSYSVGELKQFIARAAQLSDSLGVRLDAGIVWDAIPFSFMVDWFINISEWLHTYASRDWQQATVKMLEYAYSGRIQVDHQIEWARSVYDLGVVEYNRQVCSARRTFYHRIPAELPPLRKTHLELSKDPWKPNRIINATAIGIQRLL